MAFAPAVDRVNMLHPALADGTNTGLIPLGVKWDQPANFVNQWIPGGSSTVPNNFVTFGAFVQAPDGTNTAQKVVEAATNQAHSLIAGDLVEGDLVSGSVRLKLGVIVAAAERTRIALSLTDSSFQSIGVPMVFPYPNGTQAVFDLAAGAIAVANTAFGNGFVALPATISFVATVAGIKFYLCTIEAVFGCHGNVFLQIGGSPRINPVLANFFIDAGTGNAAANTSYAGNGTSGVYAWRSNLNPSSLWNLNNQSFFEDFLNTNGIDINQTNQPGFNFYTDQTRSFAGTYGDTIGGVPQGTHPFLRNGIDFDVANSVITFHHTGNTFVPNLMSIVTDGTPTGYIGNAFKLPALFEARGGWANPPGGFGGIWPVFWTSAAEGVFQTPGQPWPGGSNLVERDFNETPNSGANAIPQYIVHEWDQGQFPTVTQGVFGVPYPANITPDFTQTHTYSAYVTPAAVGFPASGASRNILPNSSFAGAVAGTPGTLPNNASVVLQTGLALNIISLSGGKLQFRLVGTVTGGGITQFFLNSLPHFSSANGTMAAGQIWTGSISGRLVSGNEFASGSGVLLMLAEANTSDAQFGGQTSAAHGFPSNTVPLTRFACTYTPQATSFARLQMLLQWQFSINNVVDLTYEIYQPQLELSAVATPFQNSFSTGDPAGVLGVAMVDAEPFIARTLLYFDGNHCADFNVSAIHSFMDPLSGPLKFLLGDNLHYPIIFQVSEATWPSYYDWVSVFGLPPPPPPPPTGFSPGSPVWRYMGSGMLQPSHNR